MVANTAFTVFATGLLWCKHIFASYLRCANLMQIHFFVQCLIQRIILIYLSEVKALTYDSQPLSERIIPIIKERNDLGTPQKVRPYTL